ncbi:COX15/CtaA family protein [Actomonas aquatica]|uniref:COX15/CtaA family protein n=1 Tax=Actomonas aquatica TaxID=2866162 RepID=A0ABZ1CGP8_9BACT|nr:COX15/CtaA family protein [Opitutus sp. WL0086]WRQ89445.1 COX15/CtaA family protein [Opitutus sp. WL0086]
MPLLSTSARSSSYQPGLAWFATLGGIWVFVLVMLGAFTTSIGAGMIFLDWPLSNGSLNPDGWLSDIMMFAEHSHRLSAGMMSFITIGIWLAVWKKEARAWVRHVALFAVALVFVQALVGGLRVLLDHIFLDSVSVGRLFAMLHACLAQVYVCTLLTIALALSRPWIEASARSDGLAALSRLGRWCCGLLLLQLAIAAIMRHSYAGMAIPTFPLSSADGDLLPPLWNFRVGIHFAHRVMAVVLSVALITYAVKLAKAHLGGAGTTIATLLVAQVALGASVIWTTRNPYVTTGHVLVGALLLATTYGATLWTMRREGRVSV